MTATMNRIAESAKLLPVSVDAVNNMRLKDRREGYKELLHRYNASNCDAVAALFREERRRYGR
jgi:hypothetical protein